MTYIKGIYFLNVDLVDGRQLRVSNTQSEKTLDRLIDHQDSQVTHIRDQGGDLESISLVSDCMQSSSRRKEMQNRGECSDLRAEGKRPSKDGLAYPTPSCAAN